MRAKSRDQRKGQWIINKIRQTLDYKKINTAEQEKQLVEIILWNMENEEFDKLLSDYND